MIAFGAFHYFDFELVCFASVGLALWAIIRILLVPHFCGTNGTYFFDYAFFAAFLVVRDFAAVFFVVAFAFKIFEALACC